ncbi:peptidase [candidate division KSB1 bacterium]|nr:MAG: peptidase [candidate division KSB1 bacterium]
MVGREASTDGSVITCHSCDGRYRTWLNIVPHKKYAEGATNKIYWGKMHTETSWDIRGMILKGEIPQVKETYAFLNTCYPCLNEKQLAIGETTIGGRRELYNDDGLFVIEELQRIVLERCTTAREAIKLIGELVKKYGYGDRGECITIADPKEVWQLEIFGAGPMEVGSVWAAQRIPDDHVGISANIPRIGELHLDDPDHYMASDNVFSLAEEMGWWDSKSGEPFKFWKAYSGRKPFSTREYYVLSTLAPSLNLKYDAEELPFSVKPDKKVSVRDVMKFYRETYEGTEFDMTKNLMVKRRRRRGEEVKKEEMIKSPVVSPWMSRDMINLFNTLKPGVVKRYRTIAISACSYSQIIQCRGWLPDAIGGIAWFAFDNPGESPRIPIFAGVLRLLKSFEIGGQHRFRTDSALWHFRRANRLATVRWGYAGKYIKEAVKEFEDKAFAELPFVEKKALELYNSEVYEKEPIKYREYLTKYTNDFARAAMQKWWELGDQFWAMFAMGF